jgi:ATP-dependent RNA helicase DeaD
MLFTEMGLSSEILKGINALGFETATPIQEKVIPVLLKEKRDIIGLAQTGTGKTAAFGLPALEQINTSADYPQLLILSPTRELCMQISRDLETYSKFIPGIKIVSVYGGASMESQIKQIKQGAQIVVATPGRIYDLLRRKRINLSKISTLVLDEADEMLKMGFREDVDAILATTPSNKNTLLFSATMAPDILAITKNYMSNPIEITIGKKNAVADNLSHIYHVVQAKDRYNTLKRVVDNAPDIYGIVFCRTRIETKEVAASLMTDGYNAEALHGDLSQAQRDYVMQKFREKNLRVLVATDVAARGLDVNSLTHVINYNLPDDVEIYTHRTGRTGRAGKEGTAVSIITSKERGRIGQIEKVIRKEFDLQPIPGGKEICERQMINMVERLKNTPVATTQIESYMDSVNELFSDLTKEDIIKRFVSQELNRFLDYYKNAPDLNANVSLSRDGEKSSARRRDRKGSSMSRVLFNVGKGKNITRREIIDLLINIPGARNVDIGLIEIYKRASSVEVDSKMAKQIIQELNRTKYKGVSIEAEENTEFSGNDFRDRNKGPRGKRR